MKRVLVTGATGIAGRFIVENLLSAGYEVRAAARHRPGDGFYSRPVEFNQFALDPKRDWQALFDGVEFFVHCAFDHLPGRYRGGEGSDPETFRRLNFGGSIALFKAARQAGVMRAIFLSSRAVYGKQPAGMALTEETEPHPDTLYGEMKLETERAMAEIADENFLAVSLRATGIYGPAAPGGQHKWHDLFASYLSGEPIAPRIGTEVHGGDFAAAVRLLLETGRKRLTAAAHHDNPSGLVFNISDILLDRHDLLAELKAKTGSPHPLPERSDPASFNVMDSTRLKGLGWHPRGGLDLSGML